MAPTFGAIGPAASVGRPVLAHQSSPPRVPPGPLGCPGFGAPPALRPPPSGLRAPVPRPSGGAPFGAGAARSHESYAASPTLVSSMRVFAHGPRESALLGFTLTSSMRAPGTRGRRRTSIITARSTNPGNPGNPATRQPANPGNPGTTAAARAHPGGAVRAPAAVSVRSTSKALVGYGSSSPYPPQACLCRSPR